MKKAAIFAVLVVLLLLGVLTFYGTGAIEYRTVVLVTDSSLTGDILNSFGADGWTIVSQRPVASDDNPMTGFMLKRPVRLLNSNRHVKVWKNVLGDQPQALGSK